MESTAALPSADSPDLGLSHPTAEECAQIWTNTAASWKDSLTVPLYLAEARHLTTVPLAQDGGMATWVLADKTLPPSKRQVLCSCESFRKWALVSDETGRVEEGIIHGVASVFCPSELQGRGYGSRHMKEMAKVLNGWQSEHGKSIGSILYSDIGCDFYARFGWRANPRNGHYIFPAAAAAAAALTSEHLSQVHLVTEPELEKLCRRDETMVYKAMATPSSTARKRAVVLPDLDHMIWHIRKEDFATNHIFGSTPHIRGAISGSPGKQVWAIWSHRYYGHPDHPTPEQEDEGGNPLYILRLVVEGDETANKPWGGQDQDPNQNQNQNRVPPQWIDSGSHVEQAVALRSVLRAAQAEAAAWRLDHVALWEPSPLVHGLLGDIGLDATWVERQDRHIASALWFGDADDGAGDANEGTAWVNNEYYAWC